MTFEQLKKQIEENKIQSYYLFYGPEEYLKDLYLRKIEDNVLAGGFADMNKSSCEGISSFGKLSELCEAMPVLAERRLIISKNSLKNFEDIGDFLDKLPKHVTIIFRESEIDKRTKTFKEFQKRDAAVEFPLQSTNILAKWISSLIKSAGKQIDFNSALRLAEQNDGSMNTIYNETQKLISYSGEKSTIDLTDINQVCSRNTEESIFELTDSIASGNSAKAFKILEDMLFAKEPVSRILFMITRQFRNMLKIKLYSNEGVSSQSELMSKSGIRSSYELGKLKRQSGPVPVERLRLSLRLCLDADASIKSGKMEEKTALEVLVAKLTEN